MAKTEHSKIDLEKLLIIVLPALGIIMLFLTLLNLFGESSSKMIEQQSHADLISTNEISTLSVSEFIYNGIAQSLNDDGKPDYNILYKSTVKVSVDANSIEYIVDDKQKTIAFVFPEFIVQNPVIDVNSVSFIPDKRSLYMDDVIALCRSDALSEAKKSDKLISSAQENLRSIIEAWYSPVFQGYSFEYIFDNAKGG